MPQRLTAEQANVLLASPVVEEREQALAALPAGVDVALVAKVLTRDLREGRRNWYFVRRGLRPEIIRAVMAELETIPGPGSVFLRVYLAEARDLSASWEEAATHLESLGHYTWGSRQKTAKLRALAANPRVLRAMQAAVVSAERTDLSALAVLVIDGSEASVDALMPHFERAVKAKGRELDSIRKLKKYAGPGVTQMLVRVGAVLTEKNATSPAIAFGARRGFGTLKALQFRVFLGSDVATRRGGPRFQGHLAFDSGQDLWFSVHVHDTEGDHRGNTRFGSNGVISDGLKLGICGPDDVPQWLSAAATKLQCHWEPFRPLTSLRGKKREQMMQWLMGG